MQNQYDDELIRHLKQALLHLDAALQGTVHKLRENPASKKALGTLWEDFLGSFFGRVRTVGKDNKINLLNLISITKLRKF